MRLLPVVLLLACRPSLDDPEPEPAETSTIFDVDTTASWSIPSLTDSVEVLRTEGNVPHIYAHNRADAVRVMGFLYAQDRLFTLDLARRLSLGEVAGLLGDLGLQTDIDSRLIGMTAVAENLYDNASAEHRALFAAYAEGVNAAIAATRSGALPTPSELTLAGPLLGATDPTALLEDFDERDVAAVLGTLVYQLAFNRDDLVTQSAADAIADGLFDGKDALGDLRQAGAEQILGDIAPIYDVVAAPGWELGTRPPSGARSQAPPPASRGLVDDLAERLLRHGAWMGMPRDDIRGSNAWAVMGTETSDGRALLAGDGHLALSIPSLFWQYGMDTAELGGGDLTHLGLGLPGAPTLAVGTNGHVAWSQTRLRGDPLDWYREELQLGPSGLPVATKFEDAWRPVNEEPEQIDFAGVLGGSPGTLSFSRYTTFDGRWIVSVEGTPSEGETGVRLPDGWVQPEDIDGDGIVTAISMDYAAFDPARLIDALDGFGLAKNVEEFREATRYLVAYGQNIVAADTSGSVLHTSYQSVPCREDLERTVTGWGPGADPGRLLDGNRYGAFSIPINADGTIQDGGEGSNCAIPFEDHPWSIDPPSGWVMTANQDPGGSARDGNTANDAWYLGGPWDAGFRAHRITELLDEAKGDADIAAMSKVQQDAQAADARVLWPELALSLERLAATDAWTPRLAQATERMQDWADRGFPAASGVVTFYDPDAEQDADDSVATMLYYAMQSHLTEIVFDDESLPEGIWRPYASTGVIRALHRMLEGRGPDNPGDLDSWSDATEESAFFDILGTPALETSDDVILMALVDALDGLEAPPTDEGIGGFGTADMDAWRWGLRHMVRFESLLADFLGDQPLFLGLTRQFAITPERLPIDADVGSGDPRDGLPGYPRPGGNGSVDASTHGFDTDDFTYTHGPAFRMVFALGEGRVEGVNILPGGQSAITESPWFHDQAELWLGNETFPMRFYVEDVVEGAIGRESFSP